MSIKKADVGITDTAHVGAAVRVTSAEEAEMRLAGSRTLAQVKRALSENPGRGVVVGRTQNDVFNHPDAIVTGAPAGGS